MIDELAAILQGIDSAAKDSKSLAPLLSTLSDNQSGIFSGALLLKGGYGKGPFVVVGGRRCNARAARSWMRWPLRRLFTHMKPSRIVDPVGSGTLALAIPFAYGDQRYVVIAPLEERATSGQYEAFFSILESLTIPEPTFAVSLSGAIPATPIEPVIFGFALCDELFERIQPMLTQRGWEMRRVPAFGELFKALGESAPDIVAIDAAEFSDPLTAVTSLHRAADSAALRVLAFTSETPPIRGAAPVIDCIVPHDATQEIVFDAFKRLASEAYGSRRALADDADAETKLHVAQSLTPRELVEFAVTRAAEAMHGWAYCMVVNDYGIAYSAEFPLSAQPVFSTIPKSFLNDVPIFDLRVGERFLKELTDEPFEHMRFMALRPLSGASIPIVSRDGLHQGVLVACSRHRWASSASFAELDRLARIVAARFADLQPNRLTIPEFRQARLWERLRDRGLGLDVYRSASCTMPWRYRAMSNTSGLFTLGLRDDSALYDRLSALDSTSDSAVAQSLVAVAPERVSFAAAIDFAQQSMNYASVGFPPPVALNRRGPAGSVRSAGGVTAGVASLTSADGTVVCDSDLWRWLNRQRGSNPLRTLLDEEAPPGLASIVTLG